MRAGNEQNKKYVDIADVCEITGNLMSIPHDFDRPITMNDVSESIDLIKSLSPADVIPIPKDATNGDVIETTGLFEAVRNLSNDMRVCVSANGLIDLMFISFDRDWWNAPYKKEIADESTD